MKFQNTASIFLVSIGLILGSCGQNSNETVEQSTNEESMEHHDHSGHDHNHGSEDGTSEIVQLPIAENAKVMFLNLKNGDKVKSPFTVQMGLEGMEVEPAGELNEGKGHHHIVINGGPIERGVIVPADDNNIHFGKGQTETELTLEPGSYTLTLQFADGFHQSYGEQLSATITVEVE